MYHHLTGTSHIKFVKIGSCWFPIESWYLGVTVIDRRASSALWYHPYVSRTLHLASTLNLSLFSLSWPLPLTSGHGLSLLYKCMLCVSTARLVVWRSQIKRVSPSHGHFSHQVRHTRVLLVSNRILVPRILLGSDRILVPRFLLVSHRLPVPRVLLVSDPILVPHILSRSDRILVPRFLIDF